jgi:hypothetical protein
MIIIQNNSEIIKFQIINEPTTSGGTGEIVIIYTNTNLPNAIIYKNVTYIVTQLGNNIDPINDNLTELVVPFYVNNINNYAFNSNLKKLFFLNSENVYIRTNTFKYSTPTVYFFSNKTTLLKDDKWNNLNIELITTLTGNYSIIINNGIEEAIINSCSNNSSTIVVPNYIKFSIDNLSGDNYTLVDRFKILPITTINMYAFNLYNLTTIYFGKFIDNLYDYIFANNIRNIYFYKVPTNINDNAFTNITNISSVTAYFLSSLSNRPISTWNGLRVNTFTETAGTPRYRNTINPNIQLNFTPELLPTTISIVTTNKFPIIEKKQDGIFKTTDNRIVIEKSLFINKDNDIIITTIVNYLDKNLTYTTKIDGDVIYVTINNKQNNETFNNLIENISDIKYFVFIFNTKVTYISGLLNLDVKKINKELESLSNSKSNYFLYGFIIFIILILILFFIFKNKKTIVSTSKTRSF